MFFFQDGTPLLQVPLRLPEPSLLVLRPRGALRGLRPRLAQVVLVQMAPWMDVPSLRPTTTKGLDCNAWLE